MMSELKIQRYCSPVGWEEKDDEGDLVKYSDVQEAWNKRSEPERSCEGCFWFDKREKGSKCFVCSRWKTAIPKNAKDEWQPQKEK